MSIVGTAGGGAVSLSGGIGTTVQQIDGISPYNTAVSIRFKTDGTVETGKFKDGNAMVWTSAGSWIQNGVPSIDFDVRFTNLVQTSGTEAWNDAEAEIEDTWIDLGTERVWRCRIATEATNEFSCDFEVRDGGGAPPDTGSSSYTFKITNIL